MIPPAIWEHQNAIKTLYSNCVSNVCRKHDITRIELDILLFLANNPSYDTATDIVEIRYLAKSQVSAAIRHMETCGYLTKEYAEDNRKTAHLHICDSAADIVSDGQNAQRRFFEIMMEGIPQEEIDSMRRCMDRISANINQYLKN
ncbi:MAG: MarR family transcriptional regulator [Lachnospiraceae bacterium]|nr:MarR family transcriptional regulator [Lachnospiraceae bacterium]